MVMHTARASVVFLVIGLALLGGCLPGQKPSAPQPPQAQFSFTPITPKVGDEVVFDASASKDPDGQIIEYLWDFGDGSPSESGPAVIHVYDAVGKYTVKLTVTDSQGLSNSLEKSVQVVEEAVGGTKKSLSLGEISPAAVTWGDGAFWVVDAQEPKVYKIDPTEGRVLLTVDLEQFEPPIILLDGIAWAEGKLWIIDGGEGKLYQIDPNAPRKPLRSLAAPGPQPTGIAWDGSALWVSDAEKLKIYKINPVTGKPLDIVDAPGVFPQGLAWDGQYLWNHDPAEQKIYKLTLQDTLVAELETPSSDPTGIAWDGQSLWVADGSERKLFQIDLSGL